jgi:hypothetical protein
MAAKQKTEEKKLSVEEIIEKIETMIEGSDYANTGYDEYWYTWSVKHWEKYDKNRIYINLTYGRTYKGKRKWTRGCKFYIDLDGKTYRDVSDNYNNAGERHFCENLCESIITLL